MSGITGVGNKFHDFLMAVGSFSGCHQNPDRSFKYRGKQFPVCARCTGAFVGYFVGAILFFFLKVPLLVNLSFCAVMFFDWFVQRIGLKESTNMRRFITGIFCGFGLVQIYFRIVEVLIGYIVG